MQSGMYYALDAAHMKKGPVWKRRLGNTGSSARQFLDNFSAAYASGASYPGGQTLFVAAPNVKRSSGATGVLYALNPTNGHVVWSVPVNGEPQEGAATVYDDVVVVPTQNDVTRGGSGGAIEVRSVTDGHLLGSMTTSAPPVSPVVILYGDLCFTTADGAFHVVSLTR
jgi:outer membrane protein assembly factor BamB